ncbi:MAG: Do family serine endopeptidase [Cyclobacteriaceae bacterium]|nr:MAG: Do family serine endopeptidase [Cyclobacteriaceae bacterium]
MKRFGSLLLAAILGSVITIVATQSFLKQQAQGVKIEHVNGLPVSQVAYTTNEKGEVVPLDFTGTAEKVTKAVVHIRSTQESRASENSQVPDAFRHFFFDSPFENQMPRQSTGSGVIINRDGYIVTNNHVVEGSEIVQVTLSDNRELKAEVIGTDPDTDLAVIKVIAKDLPYLSFVNSDETKVGQWVLAVGNPFNLNSTVTAGIISAKGRNINIINSNRQNRNGEQVNTSIESFIQTDAAINPGNSGGALVDLNGGLVGINTAIASPTGSYSGYGFAVPANIVSKITEDLIAFGTVQRGWLGINVTNVTGDLAKENDLVVNEGAFVAGFGDAPDKSAAKAAGVKEGDVVVKLDETAIKSSTGLIEYIGRKRPGDKVSVTVNRGGKEVVIPVTLKNRDGNTSTVKREENADVATLGFELEELDSKTLKRLDIASGVKVKDLANSKLKRSGMREGFIITHVDDNPVKSTKEVNEIIKKKKAGELITFAGLYEDYPREYIYALRM